MGLILVSGILLVSLLLTGWGVQRREAFTRALPYLLPWLGLNLFPFTLLLGSLLFPPPPTAPLLIALASLLLVPLSFAVAMIRLRLGKQSRSILLSLSTAGTLGMTLVQLMMLMRLTVLHFLGLSMIWTPALIAQLILNVLFTALALVFLLTLLLLRRRKVPPTRASSQVLVMPSPQQG